MRNLEQRMEDFESILQQQQFEGGTATGVLDHEWVASVLHMSLIHNVVTIHEIDITHSFIKYSALVFICTKMFQT